MRWIFLGTRTRLRASIDRFSPSGFPGVSGACAQNLCLGGALRKIAESLRYAKTLGCNVLHVNFRSRSAEEYCDQIAAFGRDVFPLVES